jgi:hypothetical protein
MDNYTVAWIVWGAVFLLIEGAALLDKDPGDTLSEHVWRWLKVRGRETGKSPWTFWVLRGILFLFLAWLTSHLVFGWPPGLDPRG